MRIDHLMQPIDLILLTGQHIIGLRLLCHELSQLILKSGLGGIIFVLHGEDVLVDGNLVFQKIV